MRFIILTILFFPLISFAQESGVVQIGEKEISYTELFESDDSTLYYSDTSLVASTHDRDGDGQNEVWLQYDNDEVTYEAHDVDGDGVAETFISLRDDEVQNVIGEPARWQKEESVDYTELVEGGGSSASAPSDLVGSLDLITIPKAGGFPWWIIILFLAAGGGYRYYKKRKVSEAN